MFYSPTFLKVRTINFTNYDDDILGYDPELYVLKNVVDTSIEVSDYNVVIKGSKGLIGMDDTIDDEELCANGSDEEKFNNTSKLVDYLRNLDDEDLYGPSFFQKSIHWVCCMLYINKSAHI